VIELGLESSNPQKEVDYHREDAFAHLLLLIFTAKITAVFT
jgi:hypothetical protein